MAAEWLNKLKGFYVKEYLDVFGRGGLDVQPFKVYFMNSLRHLTALLSHGQGEE